MSRSSVSSCSRQEVPKDSVRLKIWRELPMIKAKSWAKPSEVLLEGAAEGEGAESELSRTICAAARSIEWGGWVSFGSVSFDSALRLRSISISSSDRLVQREKWLHLQWAMLILAGRLPSTIEL